MDVLACIALYVIVGAITGGYIQGIKKGTYPGRELGWDNMDTFGVSIGWPLTWLWYGFIKPVVKLGGWAARKQQELILARSKAKEVREREREIQERERHLRIVEGMPAVEKFMAGEEDTHHEPKRMRG